MANGFKVASVPPKGAQMLHQVSELTNRSSFKIRDYFRHRWLTATLTSPLTVMKLYVLPEKLRLSTGRLLLIGPSANR